MNSTKTKRTEVIKRIANLINLYAYDDQEVRELERVIMGWMQMKRKLREKEQNVNV